MPAISKIRFANVVYDNGNKRYIDTTFRFDGYNGILLLENGAGKTVFVQTLIQAVLPRKTVAQRKIQETLQLNNSIAHIAVEWILEEKPRRYALTAVSLFRNSKEQLASQEFAMEYPSNSSIRLDTLPFFRKEKKGKRPATKEEMAAYFRDAANHHSLQARFFSENDTLLAYESYLEEHFKIIPSEWNKIAAINESEGGVEAYFENCRTTNELVDRLLIPTIEEGINTSHGHEDNGFVSLFESQRDHFKQQNKLKKQIDEMQSVLAELERYTAVQKELHTAEEKMAACNAQLKAWDLSVEAARQQRLDEEEQLTQALSALQQSQKDNEQKTAACDVAEVKEEFARMDTENTAAAEAWQSCKRKLQQLLSAYNNLVFARKKRDAKQAEQSLEVVQQALQELNAAVETRELAEKLAENTAFLKGYFDRQGKQEDAALATLAGQLQTLQEKIADARQQVRQQQAQRQQILQQYSADEGQIKMLVAQQEKIEETLFSDSLHQDPLQQQQQWQQQEKQLVQALTAAEKNIVFYQEEAQKTTDSLKKCKAQLPALQQQEQDLQLQITATDSQAKGFLQKLQHWPPYAQAARTTWELYQRASFLSRQLEDDVTLLEEKRKQADIARRQARRWLDVYEGQREFTADPALLQKLDDWSADFMYLKSGAEVFQNTGVLEASARQVLYKRYPYWAATLVTTAEEVDKLLQRLQQAADKFFQPVYVITDAQVRSLVSGKELPLPIPQIVPAYWHNVWPNNFTFWLNQQRQQAEEADASLQEKEQALEQLRPLQQDLQIFYKQHPFERYRDILNQKRSLGEQIMSWQLKIENQEQMLQQCRQSVEKYQKQRASLQQKQLQLENRLQKAAEYFDLRDSQRECIRRNEERMRQVDVLNKELSSWQPRYDELKSTEIQLLTNQEAAKLRKQAMHKQLYWHDVQASEGKESDYTYETLVQRRQQLISQLEGTNANRGRLEAQRDAAQKDINRLAKEMAKLRQTATTVIDETCTYPENGAEQEQLFLTKRSPLQAEEQQKQDAYTQVNRRYECIRGQYEHAKKTYYKQYERLLTFSDPLLTVRKKLADEKIRLQLQNAETQQLLQETQREARALQKLQLHLERKNEVYGFKREEVTAAILDNADDLCAKELEQQVLPCLTATKAVYEKVAQQKQVCQEAKDTFIRYCETQVQDERLRRSIVDGIRSKKDYQEYSNWQNKNKHRLQLMISLSESERKNHYEQMEHMVNQMELYIHDVCNGLQELADKTRIKVGETSKNIYQITVPDWDAAMARTAIRTYLNDLALALESDDYKDELGQENSKKVQETLRKRLRTQQLVNGIFGNHAIRVRCRKATSSNDFSERAHSWEDSNKWSGGEMWSKNMALFLGCLNYLSEKRCHIRRSKFNNRVVVADNPFGKASSDHVLDPVFFIAKQLGFQIIALTAHRDGNFIRKYFPIVYSCRFEEMANKKGRVLVPEKEIKTAFFEENNPQSLTRLDEYEQLGLF